MQLNVGIIAATIPTLGPLFRKRAVTTSYNPYNQFDGRANVTIGSGIKTPRSRSVYSISTYAGPGQVDYEMTEDLNNASDRGRTTHIYSGHDERLGSEDDILGHGDGDAKGIRCTTKVIVRDADKDRQT